jgi:hypothetical protein
MEPEERTPGQGGQGAQGSGLDLYSTQLVVLSTYDTSFGELSPGEVAFGLHRALESPGRKCRSV